MKYTVILTFLMLPFASVFSQQTVSEQLAAHIAQKIKDTLQLSSTLQSELYAINLQLHNQKMNVRQQYAASPDSIRLLIQRVENTRDSQYKEVLGSEKYLLYKQRKRLLVNSN